MIKVLIVEDSFVVRENMKFILEQDPELKVAGMAGDGQEGIELAKRLRPDVITMDINMPKMNGFLATRRIMETCPTPIVIVSASWEPDEIKKTFQALEAGAVSILRKPQGLGHPDYEKSAREIIQTVKQMSEVKVVTRRPRLQMAKDSAALLSQAAPPVRRTGIELVAIGASTGGPLVLQTILSLLPGNLPAPVIIVQHITEGFIGGLVDWLNQSTGFPVHLAAAGEYMLPGHAYLAPDDFNIGVSRSGQITLSRDEKENFFRPSISYLFRAVARNYGPNAAGVLLTGMGSDGAKELKMMEERGAVTLAQNKESCAVFGMPGEAVKLGAAQFVLPPEQIARELINLVSKKNTGQ